MADVTLNDTQTPAALREKDALERDEKFEDAGDITPTSDELTAHERAALTRRILLKLDFRCAMSH
jgi:hypothetical protein